MPKAGENSATESDRGTTFQVSVLRSKLTGQVLFLEAGKDFVDLLLSFLLLPVGTILHMLSTGPVKGKHLGGMSSVFESVKNLERSFLNVDKQTLVEPRPAAVGTCVSIGLLQRTDTPNPSGVNGLPKVYYRCNSKYCTSLSSKTGSRCEPCLNQCGISYTYCTAMTVLPKDLEALEAATVDRVKVPVEDASSSSGQGFVKESITYMITDSLEIMPSTTIRSNKVLNKLKVATLSDLESSDITVSIAQVNLHPYILQPRCFFTGNSYHVPGVIPGPSVTSFGSDVHQLSQRSIREEVTCKSDPAANRFLESENATYFVSMSL